MEYGPEEGLTRVQRYDGHYGLNVSISRYNNSYIARRGNESFGTRIARARARARRVLHVKLFFSFLEIRYVYFSIPRSAAS